MSSYTYEWLERNGRLGNQLWQIAWQIGQAESNKGQACIKPDWEYRKFFSVPDEYFQEPTQHIVDGETQYFQELRYFQGCENLIWKIFQPSHKAYDQLFTYSHEINKSDYSCSIHHRRGDYVKLPLHYPAPTDKYYETAAKEVLAKRPETTFFIFSDDPRWVKNHYLGASSFFHGIKDQLVFVTGAAPRPVEVVDRRGEPQDWLDLFAMSFCDEHIISNSTFSWWAAFLSITGRAFYPSRWFGEHESVRDIPWRKSIPSTWKEIEI